MRGEQPAVAEVGELPEGGLRLRFRGVGAAPFQQDQIVQVAAEVEQFDHGLLRYGVRQTGVSPQMVTRCMMRVSPG